MPRSTRIVMPLSSIASQNVIDAETIERLYTEPETATILRVSRLTLRKWRINGTGPRHTKMGKQVLYRASEIERYIDERTSSGSSDENKKGDNT